MKVPFLGRFRWGIRGALDYVDGREVVGWALDLSRPAEPLTLEIVIDDIVIGSTRPSLKRPDVAREYNVEGAFGFNFYASPPIADKDIDRTRVLVKGIGIELGSAHAQRVKTRKSLPHAELRIGISNLAEAMKAEPAHYGWVRIDPIMNCNLHCVYCHNGRTSEVFELDRMKQVLEGAVLSAENVYIGCVMEPTLDPRLAEVVETIASSPAKPSKIFGLQTNGTLLKNHDVARLLRAGLNQVTISVDTLDDKTLRFLRGVNSKTVTANVSWLRRQFPELDVSFLATVTKANIDQIPEFIRSSLALGIRKFTLHEVFHIVGIETVDRGLMQSLLLDERDFYTMKQKIMHEFAGQAEFIFAHDSFLDRVSRKLGIADEITITSRVMTN